MKDREFDVHATITNRIIEAIEAGAGNFVMPWHGAACAKAPINVTSRKAYRGVNILSLWITGSARGYASNEWATFKQWQERGAQVRKGEKGTPIVFYKQLAVSDDNPPVGEVSGEALRIPFARASWVFNAAQIDGYSSPEETIVPPALFERLANVEAAISATGANISYGGSRAFYDRVEDRIQIPNAGDFVGTETSTARESFYSTVLHELAHLSGASHRLNREKGKRFADRAYAFEEIVAELSAAFSCVRLGITSTPRADHAQYIAGYLEILRGDKKAIFAAAAAATAATDYILAFSQTVLPAAIPAP